MSNFNNTKLNNVDNVGNYVIGSEIGRGSFANVYKGINNLNNSPVAIKSVLRSKLKSKKLIENLEIEISILKNLKHPHIVSLLDCQKTSVHFHLVMEYCSLGDLSYFIRKREELVKSHPLVSSVLERYPSAKHSHGLNKTLVLHFLKQLSSALKFLRDKSLVHRDIKPQNLLLCPPPHSKAESENAGYVGIWELPVLKIADFGFARFLPNTSMAETLCGSPLYMAPEILRYEKYNAKADLWSVGAVLYEMAVGKPPFRALNHVELLRKIEVTADKISFPESAQVPEDIRRLVCSLLKCNPTERMSFQEFFTDELITCELKSNDEPLELSMAMDENLFISEYISPLQKRAQQPHEDHYHSRKIENIKEEDENLKNSIISPNESLITEQHKNETFTSNIKTDSNRDEEIKKIIIKNSPAPEGLEHSISTKKNQSSSKDDIILEKDYVVVEKRAVEVNAIADELQRAGSGAVAINTNHFQSRRLSSRSSSGNSIRRPSFNDRRISISISPSNALTKALGLASTRLFGTNYLENQLNQQQFLSLNQSSNLTPQNFSQNLLQNVNIPYSKNLIWNINAGEDTDIISKLEALATKAHAINLFADVKFSQLIPSPPSSDAIEDDSTNDFLPPTIVKGLAEEGVVLYVKTLSLLAKAMVIASDWWYNNSDNKSISLKLNELVQWVRERFNECLEKAEFVRLRLQESNEALGNVASSNSATKVVAEKLIFDRALEISRNAAVNELVKEDLKGCELAYSTAIWMLEALLDEDEENYKLDNEDKVMVEKFIVSIGNRLNVLKKKLESNN